MLKQAGRNDPNIPDKGPLRRTREERKNTTRDDIQMTDDTSNLRKFSPENASYTGLGTKKSSKPLVDLDSGTRIKKRTLHMQDFK